MCNLKEPKDISDVELAEEAKDARHLMVTQLREIDEQIDRTKATFATAMVALEASKVKVKDYYKAKIPAELELRKERYNKALQGFENASLIKKVFIPEEGNASGVGMKNKILESVYNSYSNAVNPPYPARILVDSCSNSIPSNSAPLEHETIFFSFDPDKEKDIEFTVKHVLMYLESLKITCLWWHTSENNNICIFRLLVVIDALKLVRKGKFQTPDGRAIEFQCYPEALPANNSGRFMAFL
jgi:hypothetical protein